MDEKQLQMLFNEYAKGKGFKDFGEFKSLMDDEASRKVFFEDSNKELGFKDFNDFNATLGVKKKEPITSLVTPSQLPKISEQVSPLQQGANIVGGGVIGDISKTAPKEGTRKENDYFKQIAVGIKPSAQGDVVERIYENPMGVEVLQVEPKKREAAPQQPVQKAESKDKPLKGVKPIAPTKTELNEQGWLLNMVSAIDKGIYKTLGTTAQGAGTLLQGVTSKITGGTGEGFISDALIKFGDSYNKMIDELTPQDESFKGSLSDQVGQALGFVGGLALTGGASSVARGSSALMQQAPKSGALTSAVKELVKGTVSPTGVVGGLTMGQAEFDRAKQSGATDEQAFEAFYKNAAVGSVLERIPVMHFLKRFNQSTAGGVVNYIKTKGVAGLTGGVEEMTTEMLQQLYANKTAKDIYNTNQDLFEGVVGNGTIGFSVGFLLNAMGANAKILRKEGKVNEAKLVENQVKELQEKAKGVAPPNKSIATKIAINGNEEGLQRTQAELDNDLQKGLISEEEYQGKALVAQKAAEVNAKIPDYVQGVNRAESIDLINERENLQQELAQKEEQKKSIDVAYHKSIDESNKEVQKRIDEINNQLGELAKPEKNKVEEEIQQPIDFSKKTDDELEKRQTEIENAKFGTAESKEFNEIDKELEKREWRKVFDAPINEIGNVVDELIRKDKEMPNGWGSYIDRKDARLTKDVAERYINSDLISDEEVIEDFKDAMFGNPTTWYSDGLKLRESLRVASERGVDVLDSLSQEFIKDGYSKEDAVNMVKRKLEPILENVKQEQAQQNQLPIQQIPDENIQQPIEEQPELPSVKDKSVTGVEVKTMDDFATFKDAVAYNVKRTADIGIDESEANYGGAKNINEIKLDLEKAGIQVEKVPQSSMSDGNYASFDGDKIKVTDENIPLQVLLHEIGEKVVLDLDKTKQKIEHANNIFEAVTTYGASRGNDAFADNFYLYFLSPQTLKDLSPNVYSELDRLIPQKIKDLGKSLMSKYGVTEQTLKYRTQIKEQAAANKEQAKSAENKGEDANKKQKDKIKEQPEIVEVVRVEQEPEAKEGVKVVTLSGMVEGDRVKAVEERKKKTTLTEKETLHNDLIDLASRADKARGNEKTNLQGQIRQRVRELNAKLGEEVYKYDGVSVRTKVKSKTKGERYLKIKGTTRDISGRAIKEDAVLLFDRSPEFVQKYEQLADSPNITALQVDSGNGVTMTAEQIESAIQDIADGIPSVQADNLLNALEEGFNRGYFDLRGKDIGQDRVQATVEDFIGVQQEEVGQPLDEEAMFEWLNEISELPQEEQIEIDNIILEYEQQPQQIDISGKIQSPKPESKEGSPTSTKPSKEGEGNGKPKTEVSKQPIAEAKPKQEDVEEKIPLEKDDQTPPPPTPPTKKEDKQDGDAERFDIKSILNRIANSTNISEEVRNKFKSNLKYKVSSQAQAREVAKQIISEFGYKDALAMAEMGRFEGDVNSFIFAESLDKAFENESKAKTPEEKAKFAEEWKDIAIRYDEAARDKGRFISAIQDFYKKSPLGIVMVEESKRGEQFRDWFSGREKPFKEVFEELVKEPEFEQLLDEKVKDTLKKERGENRAKRRTKIENFFDSVKFKGDALYAVPIPPKVINAALDLMKNSFLAGESVVNAVEVAIDYITKEVGQWDKEKFRKEYQEKLQGLDGGKTTKTEQELTEEKKEKILDKFRKKLKGLSESQKEEVIRKSFKRLVENGALEYEDFKDIIADVLGYGKMTDAEVAKITELVNDINEVDKLAAEIRKDENRSIENLKKYKEAKKKAEKSATQLATLVYNKPDILKRLLSIMQLNTLGIPSLINNPLFNIFNQATVRFPVGLQVSALDQIIYGASKVGNKLFGTDVILPENNVIASQREFIRKLFQGTSESGSQLVNGLTNRDYFQKEVYASQIQPFTSAQDLWDWKFKGKKLTASQLADKSIQATIGFPAEVVARLLNIGDKPQRFAAEGAKAAVLAKQLGLSEVDYEYFLEFPKEEAYRSYKEQGMSDEAAMEKAEKTKEAIVKAGEESVFQQDNFLNDAINSVFEQSKKYGNVPYGLAQAVKMLNFPYLKIPLNAFWSVYNLVNPEVAFTQSAYYSLKAIKTKDRADIQKAKMWAAHGTTGMALLAIVGGLVAKGIVNADNDDETTKKERMGEKQYEQQKSINISKLNALIQGKDPDKVKNGLNVDLKYFGNMGNIMNTVAIRQENMTPEQKAQGADYMNELFSNLSQSSLELIDNGVFSNVSSLVTAFDRGGNYMDNYLLNLINMTTNIVQPAMFAQMSRAQLPYYSKVKADSFYEELKNNVLARSSVARELTGKYPPAQIGIWGDKLERKDDFLLKWFGMSRVNKDNFAQPIYEDYKRTKNTEFLPPSIKPLINKTKLNVKQAEELETLVGQSRKALIAPYINNLAILEGFDKKYSNLSDAEKLTALDILYSEGFKKGKNDFLAKYPQLSTQKTGFPTDEEIDRDIKKALFKLEIELKGMKE